MKFGYARISTEKQRLDLQIDSLLANGIDSKNIYTDRPASKTTANLAFVTGDLTPTDNNYGGGLENLSRFLEHWNGTEFIYSGSMIEGWRSKQATGNWRYTSGSEPYYSAPTREWSFDTDFEDPAKLPPQSPTIQLFQRTGWNQENVGYSHASLSDINQVK